MDIWEGEEVMAWLKRIIRRMRLYRAQVILGEHFLSRTGVPHWPSPLEAARYIESGMSPHEWYSR
jgi:hypothetical protein